MISGNCAIGSACMATRPPSTVMIAITMATMGRRTKKRDTLASLRLGRERSCSDRRAILRRRPLDDDAVPRLESAFHDPAAADSLPDFDRSSRNPVVGVDEANLMRALQLGYCTLRHEQSGIADLGLCPD